MVSNQKHIDVNLKSELNRFCTFTSWCQLNQCEKVKLARFGFYFKETPDVVKCIFCKLEMSYEPGENSFKKHLRWSPDCPLLNQQPTDNIPIDKDEFDKNLASIARVTNRNFQPIQYRENSCPESVQLETLEQIRRDDYNRLSQRLRSFKNCPTPIDKISQNANKLCEAGFFYSAPHDQIRCFSCGGRVNESMECFDPWELHALWYDNCDYLKNSKPISFIVNAKKKYQS